MSKSLQKGTWGRLAVSKEMEPMVQLSHHRSACDSLCYDGPKGLGDNAPFVGKHE